MTAGEVSVVTTAAAMTAGHLVTTAGTTAVMTAEVRAKTAGVDVVLSAQRMRRQSRLQTSIHRTVQRIFFSKDSSDIIQSGGWNTATVFLQYFDCCRIKSIFVYYTLDIEQKLI